MQPAIGHDSIALHVIVHPLPAATEPSVRVLSLLVTNQPEQRWATDGY